MRFKDSELLFPTVKYGSFRTTGRQGKPILKRKDLNSSEGDARLSSTPTQILTNEDSPINQTANEDQSKFSTLIDQQETQPAKSILLSKPSGSAIHNPNGNTSKFQNTRMGFFPKPGTINDEQTTKMVRFEDTTHSISQLPVSESQLQISPTRSPPLTEKRSGMTSGISIPGESGDDQDQPKEKSFLSDVKPGDTPKFSAIPKNRNSDPVETFYGKSFVRKGFNFREKLIDKQELNSSFYPNLKFSQVHRETYLPDLYDKYRPRPIEISQFNNTKMLTNRDSDPKERTRSGFGARRIADNNRQSNSFQDLRDLMSQNNTLQNNSMIEYTSGRLNDESSSSPNTPSKLIINGLRDYYSDRKDDEFNETFRTQVLEKDRIKAELALQGQLQIEKKELRSNPVYNFSLNRASPGQESGVHSGKSSSVPARRRDDPMRDSRNHIQKGPINYLRRIGFDEENQIKRIEPFQPQKINEYEKLKKYDAYGTLQPLSDPSYQTLFNTTATSMMKTKYGPFDPKQLKQPTQKSLLEAQKQSNTPSRSWTIFEDPQNLYFPGNISQAAQNQNRVSYYPKKNVLTPTPSDVPSEGGTSANRFYSDFSPLRQKYEDLQQRNPLMVREQERTSSNRFRTTRFEPKEHMADINAMVSTIYREKMSPGFAA